MRVSSKLIIKKIDMETLEPPTKILSNFGKFCVKLDESARLISNVNA